MRELNIHFLGLCEHCSLPVTMEDYPQETVNDSWKCRHCKNSLSLISFGRDPKNRFNRIKWVGPGMKWIDECPRADFESGDIKVLVMDPAEQFSKK